MKIFLAATSDKKFLLNKIKKIPYILESYYYIQDWQINYIKNCKMFLLDSGAFTFMNSINQKDKNINWDKYIEDYANFINRHDIKYFFELDIDVVVGLKEVKRLRNKLEQLTGKKCIPVWHKSRGIKEWEQICKEYDYVAIGGIVIGEITQSEYKYFKPLIEIARKYNCKVHGLGFTATKELYKYKFYSIDSTSWKSGGRFGQIHMFNKGYIKSKKQKNKRAKCYKQIDKHNLNEWLKMVDYADKYY